MQIAFKSELSLNEDEKYKIGQIFTGKNLYFDSEDWSAWKMDVMFKKIQACDVEIV